MRRLNNKKFLTILSITIIFLIQLVVFWPSFKLSLFGDDWLAFWRYETIVNADPYQQGFNYLTYYLTPYGPQDITMGLISKVFGYRPLQYYVISFALRFILTISIFFAFLELTKNKLGAFASAVFFSITIIGLETTNWVFNMPSYLGLTFFVGFLLFYFRSFTKDKLKNLILAYLLLFFALIIVPIRMHGIIPLVVFAEILWLLKNRSIPSFKLFVVRIFLLILTFWIVKQIGHSFGSPQETVNRITGGIMLVTKLISEEGTEEVILFPVSTFGNMVFPEVLWDKVYDFFQIPILGRSRPFPLLSFSIFLFYMLFAAKISKKRNYRHLGLFAFWGLLFNYIVFIFYKISPVTFSSIPAIGSTLIGSYTLIFFSLLTYLKYIDKKYHVLTLTILVLPILFVLLPWFMMAYSIFPANHRYMIVSAVGVSLLWGIMFLTKMKKGFLVVIFLIHLFTNAYVSRLYFGNLLQKRDVAISNKIWEVVYAGLPSYEGGRYYVVYFEGDATNGDVVHNNVFFGFPPRMSIEQRIIEKDDIPIAITTYNDLVKMVTKGEGLDSHAKGPEKLPVERVYAFKIEGNSASAVVTTNITKEIREKLRQELLQ